MPNAVMSVQEIKALAQLPSREQLIATLLGTLQAPMAKLVRTLNEVPGKFVRTLAAYRTRESRLTNQEPFRENGKWNVHRSWKKSRR